MSTTSARRSTERRILYVCLAVAFVLHLGLFLWNPEFRAEMPGSDVRPSAELSLSAPRDVRVDGEARDAALAWPVVLSNYDNATALTNRLWPRIHRETGIGGTAALELVVDSVGRVRSVRVQESTGDLALDEVLESIALGFRYHVDDTFRPFTAIRLIQPLDVSFDGAAP